MGDSIPPHILPHLVPLIPPGAKLAPNSRVPPENRGKTPGIYWPAHGHWTGRRGWTSQTTTADEAKAYAEFGQWGLRCGIEPGRILALDIDVTDPELAAAVVKAAHDTIGPAPQRTGNAPKTLLMYRSEQPRRKIAFAYTNGAARQTVELLGEGQQFVIAGTHPSTLKAYLWDRDPFKINIGEIAAVTDGNLERFAAALGTIMDAFGYALESRSDGAAASLPAADPESLKGDPATVAEALEHLGNDFGYDDWIALAGAAKFALGCDEAHYAIFEDWCLLYPGNTPEIAREKWNSFKTPLTGADYIYARAQAAGWRDGTGHAAMQFGALPPAEPATGRRRALYVVHYDEPAARPDLRQPWLVKYYLPAHGTGVLYGAPNSGKTFVAIDLGMAVATGTAWAGRKTLAGAVAYVAAEAGDSAKKRLEAYRIAKRPEAATPFMLVPCHVDLRRPDGDTNALVATIRQGAARYPGRPFRLVVVDTLARAMAGGNENAPEDMGALYDNVARMASALDCFALLVHHTGKDAAKGSRGHSLLPGNVDVEMELTSGRLRVTKARDQDRTELDAAFSLSTLTIGADEDGDPVTSCVVEWTARGAGDFGRQPVSSEAMAHFDALEAVISEKASKADSDDAIWVEMAEWNDSAFNFLMSEMSGNGGISVSRDTRALKRSFRNRWHRLSRILLESGWVKRNSKNQWTIK